MYNTERTNGEHVPFWHGVLAPNDEHALSASVGGWPGHAVDLVVVGGGMAGLSTAYHACRRGLSVVVLEKGQLGSGETGRTTAHVANALDDRYDHLEQLHGERGAQLAAASHAAAIEDIERIVERESIACGFRRIPGYLYSAADGRAADKELSRELAAAQRAGLTVARLEHGPAGAFGARPCLRFADQAEFSPLAYIAGLARAIARLGGRIFPRTRVVDVNARSASPGVTLDDGRTLSAQFVVVATNTPIHDRVVIHSKQAAYRSYVVAFSIPTGSLERGLFWDTADPYHYVRLAGDGDVLIVGGADHRVGQSGDSDARFRELEDWTRRTFPAAGEVRSQWSGQILEPADGLAFIGKDPGSRAPVFIATGDSGNGITHGAIAGLLLNDLMAGTSNPWASLYDPARKRRPLRTREFLRENANTAMCYTHWLLPGRQSESRIEPGHGAVVRRGLRRVAVYVDEQGGHHERSARCPHLGCVVAWNRVERSWDCPCHGSRFDPFGKVMTGPSPSDLAPLSTAEPEPRAAGPSAEPNSDVSRIGT